MPFWKLSKTFELHFWINIFLRLFAFPGKIRRVNNEHFRLFESDRLSVVSVTVSERARFSSSQCVCPENSLYHTLAHALHTSSLVLPRCGR